jgi:maleate isomerase
MHSGGDHGVERSDGPRDLFGWRARIGLIYIASSVVMEPEMYAMAPEGCSFHTTRIPLAEVGVDDLAGLGEDDAALFDAVGLLASAPLDGMVFACTSGSFVGGPGYDEKIMARMASLAPGVAVTTTTTASVAGLKEMGVRRLAIATPYTDDVNERLSSYFAGSGFEVLEIEGLGCRHDHDIGWVTPETVYRLARRVDRWEADGVFISCTNLRTAAVLQALEDDLGKPVVSANQASLWHALRIAGVNTAVEGYGRLLSLPLTGQHDAVSVPG